MKPKYSQNKKNHTLLAAGLLTASFVVTPSAQAAAWTGANANWSSNTNPGWNGTGVPNGVGAVANHAVATNSVTTVDSAVTVGTISHTTSNVGRNWTITNTSGITLDQDGSGSGTATISNTNTHGGNANFLRISGGTLTLADDLLISNATGSGVSNLLGGAILIDSVIAGTGNITISNNKIGFDQGTIQLRGANTFTGNVNLSKGSISFTNSSAFGSAATNPITLGSASGQSTNYVGTILTAYADNLTVANNWVTASGLDPEYDYVQLMSEDFNTTYSGTGTLNDELSISSGQVGNTTLSGVLSGSGSLNINGNATLSANNTYTGATSIVLGTLIVNGNISTSSLTTIGLNSTLSGSGTVGALTVDNTSIHAPGNSPGIQSTGNYLNEGTLEIEIDGATVGTQYDQVNTTGTVTLSGLLDITMGASYTPAQNALFFILANDGSDAISGTFSNASTNGNTYTLGGQDFAISYFGNSVTQSFTGGNDVVLRAVVIPEPGAALLGSLGMLMLLRRRR